ncbi:GNAT family N-acetyltransferase [Clostridium sp. AL.422]|uniref:GNAT family N-acetyltransferase n=1 Tax=Clostridium TaxID=1485 RepID=UPI00293DD1D0|nr:MULTISPECIES: GNAT family N-acetyltransferase [unclassified Clostridium]MDV4150988.1 GNAT family N-acetyltransferase [Clostridium sp. AL.422]
MNIRKMSMDDYTSVYNLWINTPNMGLNNLDDSREGISRFLNRNPDTCFIAEEENDIVGVILGGHDGRRGFIYHVTVLLEKRNKGIASILLDTALTSFKKEGINKVALVVFDKNILGNSFWEKKGFTVREDLIYRNKALTEITRIDT